MTPNKVHFQQVFNANPAPSIAVTNGVVTGLNKTIAFRKIRGFQKIASAVGVAGRADFTINATTITAGVTYEMTVSANLPDGQRYVKTYSYTAITGDTTATVRTALTALINADLAAPFSAAVVGNDIRVTHDTAGFEIFITKGLHYAVADTTAVGVAAVAPQGVGATLAALHPGLGFVAGEVYTFYRIEYEVEAYDASTISPFEKNTEYVQAEIWIDPVNAPNGITELDGVLQPAAPDQEYHSVPTL